MPHAFAFRIVGTVPADSVDEACAAIAFNLDPRNTDVPENAPDTPRVWSLSVTWREFDADPDARYYPPDEYDLEALKAGALW